MLQLNSPHLHLPFMKENLWKASVVIKSQKMFSLSSLGYCEKHGCLRREDPAPDVNIKYLNIKAPLSGKENNNLDEIH